MNLNKNLAFSLKKYLSYSGFFKSVFLSPYSVILLGTFSTNNILFFRTFLEQYYSAVSSILIYPSKMYLKKSSEYSFGNLDMRGKHLFVISFINIFSLKEFCKTVGVGDFNRTGRCNFVCIKLPGNFVEVSFLNKLKLKSTKNKFIKNLLKFLFFNLAKFHYFLRIITYLRIVYFLYFYHFLIRCQLFIK